MVTLVSTYLTSGVQHVQNSNMAVHNRLLLVRVLCKEITYTQYSRMYKEQRGTMDGVYYYVYADRERET